VDTHHLTGPSEEGGVVVDIGGDVGAAIVSTPASLVGSEIEIRRCDTAWDGTHVAVRERHVSGGVLHAALFPALDYGKYEVRLRGDAASPVATLTVEGGRVSAARLPWQSESELKRAASRPLTTRSEQHFATLAPDEQVGRSQ
jgi:hypothetical protein